MGRRPPGFPLVGQESVELGVLVGADLAEDISQVSVGIDSKPLAGGG